MGTYERLQALLGKILVRYCANNKAELARQLKKDPSYVNRLFYPESKAGAKGIGPEIMEAAKESFTLPAGFWDMQPEEVFLEPGQGTANASNEASDDLVINQFTAGGGMDSNGRLLLDDQPGTIKSWKVSPEWIQKNVPSHTGINNLAIVTGFGPSMKPMFNPGDPLLVDTGVKIINHEGVYFFRVGDEGFIKIVQRVPSFDGLGIVYRVISKNPDYPPYDISPSNPHFEVLAKVLTVWHSEQF